MVIGILTSHKFNNFSLIRDTLEPYRQYGADFKNYAWSFDKIVTYKCDNLAKQYGLVYDIECEENDTVESVFEEASVVFIFGVEFIQDLFDFAKKHGTMLVLRS